jgi:hypothetical protein
VFITALVHGLVRGGRFPVFEALAKVINFADIKPE